MVLGILKRESSEIASKFGIGQNNMMGANFRTYGASMGIYDYDDYMKYARRIYTEAMNNPGGFTIIDLPDGGKAVDFQSKLRGIYSATGEPRAFFKPDYQQLGYTNPQEELNEFRESVTSVIH